MDLNSLYHRQQVALALADRASSEPSRLAHVAMASAYADRIAAAKVAVSV